MNQPSPSENLDAFLSFESQEQNRVSMVFPDEWKQGRGLYGGLVTAAMVRVMDQHTPGRPLRSLTAELCGPLQPGEATLEWEVLRAGNAVSTVALRVVQGGEVLAHGVGVLGKARENVPHRVECARPTLAPWRDVEVVPVEPPFGPEFAQFFEFRSTGPLPFSESREIGASGWIRPKNQALTRDAAYLAFCMDAWWPSFYAAEPMPRPMATIAFTFQPFVHFDGLSSEAPLFFRSRLEAAVDGYCVEYRELWGEDGRLLALNQQTIVVIK